MARSFGELKRFAGVPYMLTSGVSIPLARLTCEMEPSLCTAANKVPLTSTAHSLKLNEDAVRAGAQTDLDDLGIAKNAREEKAAARKHKTPEDAAKEAAHHAEMAKLYAQHVLKEQPTLQIQGLGGKKKASEPAEVLHKPVV